MAALSQRFMETVRRTFLELFPPPATPNPLHEVAPMFVFALLDGLALEKILTDDPEKVTRVLNTLKNLARLVIPAEAT